MEAQEKYREECQRVFDLQNRCGVDAPPSLFDPPSSPSFFLFLSSSLPLSPFFLPTSVPPSRVLASSEVLSTDEESSSSGGESDDELGRNLETLLGGKKTSAQLTHEQEEAERQELRRLLAEDKPVSVCSFLLLIFRRCLSN